MLPRGGAAWHWADSAAGYTAGADLELYDDAGGCVQTDLEERRTDEATLPGPAV